MRVFLLLLSVTGATSSLFADKFFTPSEVSYTEALIVDPQDIDMTDPANPSYSADDAKMVVRRITATAPQGQTSWIPLGEFRVGAIHELKVGLKNYGTSSASIELGRDPSNSGASPEVHKLNKIGSVFAIDFYYYHISDDYYGLVLKHINSSTTVVNFIIIHEVDQLDRWREPTATPWTDFQNNTNKEPFKLLKPGTGTGIYSTNLGVSNTSSGAYSSALGRNNTASGYSSSALGGSNTASATYSSALGGYNDASGRASSAIGESNTASGDYSISYGRANIARKEGSVAIGWRNEADGYYSSAFGVHNKTNGRGQFIVGEWNSLVGNPNERYDKSDDYMFIVGNGNKETNRSNALTIQRNGKSHFTGDVEVRYLSAYRDARGANQILRKHQEMKYWILLMCFVHADVPEKALSGGDATVFIANQKAFSRPLANISRETRRHHSVGNSFFNKNWVEAPASTSARDGLGPLFNARSCSACHPHDGRGHFSAYDQVAIGLVMRLSRGEQHHQYGPIPDPIYGLQLSEGALPDYQPEGLIRVHYPENIKGEFTDGTPYFLQKPSYKLRDLLAGKIHSETKTSVRVAPAVHGLGLLEAIAESTLEKLADPEDGDGDGISGRINYVWDIEGQKKSAGRFGWKANQPSLRQQVASAFNGDMGITSSLYPVESATEHLDKLHQYHKAISGGAPELTEKVLDRTTVYLQSIAPPARRDVKTESNIAGEKIFHEIGCASCHIPELKTGKETLIPELANQTIRPYTDLLLHDMGDSLADHREDFDASGREWRTPPLWGIGLLHIVNRHTNLLHDGRARNVTEAILWHGGEAEQSREQFKSLNKEQRDQLLSFINSL